MDKDKFTKMADIEEIIDLYTQVPTFHPDYKDKMPPSLVKRAVQLLNIGHNPVSPEEIKEKK